MIMRNELSAVNAKNPPDHLGLAYTAWAPVGQDGKVADDRLTEWLSKLSEISISTDYEKAFERWKQSLVAIGARQFELELTSRLLVGIGNSSGTDVGLTVHHTWGVPMVPGSAIKGLTAHYVDAVYGPASREVPPWEQVDIERERVAYQGITWRNRRALYGPGPIYRALFGAPEALEDDAMKESDLTAGASRGLITFYDALHVPTGEDEKPFDIDVLTVHQKPYYDGLGESWPNDYNDPNPVHFLTVRPGTRLLFSLSGPRDWVLLAEQLVRDALTQWGIGAKTSAGYGRFSEPNKSAGTVSYKAAGSKRVASSVNTGDVVTGILLEERTKKGGWKARIDDLSESGPIQNSRDVPPELKPGVEVELIVAIAKPGNFAFKYPTEAEAERAQKKQGKKKRSS